MAKILRQEPPPHALMPDTNILWCKDKAPPVSPDFDKWWEDNAALVSIELVIPYVVRGELLFQQVTSAVKAHDKITELCSEISSITSRPHKHRLSRDKIRGQIEAKLEKWLNGKSARVAPIPVNAIDLNALAEDAIWRKPPFEADPKNPDVEKGFRDSLILETIRDVAVREKRRVNLVFVSGDFLLRTSVAERLKTDPRVMCYESLQDFSSYLKLTREKLTNEFIKGILHRAAEKFYRRDDDTCIVLRDKLVDRIRVEFKSKFENPEESESSALTSLFSLSPALASSWKPTYDGLWRLSGTEFVNLEGEREYHWKSGLTYARFFSKSSETPLGLLSSTTTRERVLILPFKIYWKANVKADARFHDTAVVNIALEGDAFREPTEEDVRKYGRKKESS